MEVWAGTITFGDSSEDVEGQTEHIQPIVVPNKYPDVHFANQQSYSQSSIAPDMKLRFLSLVDVATVPLHLAAGPSLNVWTHSESTERWFSECLLDDWDLEHETAMETKEAWWLRSVPQSDCGILLKVEEETGSAAYKMTEILIYAAVCKELEPSGVLPTPPGSSSLGADPDLSIDRSVEVTRYIKIYALPLSSGTCAHANGGEFLEALASHSKINDSEARFLPKNAPTISVPNGKRQKISSVFEDATHQRKRLLGHGGDRVSRAMAEINSFIPSRDILKSSALEDVNQSLSTSQMKGISHKDARRENLSRSSSATSLRSAESSRPPSRRGALMRGKRSSLHRVESILSTCEASHVLTANTVEQQNKSALTRIVMTGMRMYGIQQKKKSVNLQIEAEIEHASNRESGHQPEEEDEYKLIYHQTFKAASFTFRAHIAQEIINQEAMRDIVDRLLSLFCNDPLTVHTTSNTFNVTSNIDNRLASNFFDNASITARLSGTQDRSFSPIKKGVQTGELSMCESTTLLPLNLSGP